MTPQLTTADEGEIARQRYVSPHGIEQSRRDFMADYPDLYRYIGCVESAKALKSAGDSASGASTSHGAANRVWAMEAASRRRAEHARHGWPTS